MGLVSTSLENVRDFLVYGGFYEFREGSQIQHKISIWYGYIVRAANRLPDIPTPERRIYLHRLNRGPSITLTIEDVASNIVSGDVSLDPGLISIMENTTTIENAILSTFLNGGCEIIQEGHLQDIEAGFPYNFEPLRKYVS